MAPSEPITQKRCQRCGRVKPIGCFPRKGKGRSGVIAYCRPCQRENVKESQHRRRQNPDVVQRERQQQRIVRHSDEYRHKRRKYRSQPEVKAREKQARSVPHVRAMHRKAVQKHRKKMHEQNGNRPTGRPPAIATEKIIASYAEGLTTYEVANYFGMTPSGVTYRLKRAGIARRAKVMGRSCQCADGHIVRSSMEKMVDDWLFDHGIPHRVSPPCPWPPKRGCYSFADFLVGDTYIEVWGLIGSKPYERRMAEKIELYSQAKAKLIGLLPREVHSGDFTKLEPLIALGQSILK